MEKIRVTITTTRDAAEQVSSAMENFVGRDNDDDELPVTDEELIRIGNVFADASLCNKEI